MKTQIERPEDVIARLRRYYMSSDLYPHRHLRYPAADEYTRYYHREWERRIKPLRNVTARVVDFFSIKMLPGDIKIETDDDNLKAAVEQVLTWSNFDEKKKLLLTDLSLTGDLFIKVNILPDKAYLQYVLPETVTMLTEDDRGYLVDIRIEYPINDEKGNEYTYTEYWNKPEGYYAIWEHTLGVRQNLSDLGTPKSYEMLSAFGIDFIPIVHIKFKDIGRADFRGVGCVSGSLEVIDEACRQASVQARNAFRDKQTFVLSPQGKDANSFTLDPIKIVKRVEVVSTNPDESEQNVTPDDIWQAPAFATITSLLSGIDWVGLQGVVNSTMEELCERMPALRYYSVREVSNLSVKTVTLLLDAALSEARESARSFISGLIRCCQIGLTMATFSGLFPPALGSYDAGDFDFVISAGAPFEQSADDKAATLKIFVEAGMALDTAMRQTGFSEEEISQAMEEKSVADAASTASLGSALSQFNAGGQNALSS